MLRLRFYNVAPPASLEVAGESFRLNVDAIAREPSGEPVAKYAHGEWCVGDRCFLRVECSGRVICRLGTQQQSGERRGPYGRMHLIDGVLVGDEVPVAALHPGRGWVAEPGVQAWMCVCLESALP
jgi:hypothetical protein